MQKCKKIEREMDYDRRTGKETLRERASKRRSREAIEGAKERSKREIQEREREIEEIKRSKREREREIEEREKERVG